MTIAKRLIILLAVPLLALVGLGVFTRLQLAEIEARSRFVAESRIVALATLGNLSRSFAELRVNVRSYLLATDDAQRAAARAAFDEDERDVNRLLREYADSLVLDDKDRRLLGEYQTLSREWIAGAKQVMSLADEGRAWRGRRSRSTARSRDLGVRLSKVSNEWIAHDQEAATAAGQESIAVIERFQREMFARRTRRPSSLTGLLGFLTFRRIVKPDQGAGSVGQGDRRRRLCEGGAVRPMRRTKPAAWRARSTSSSRAPPRWTSSAGSSPTSPGSRESCRVRPRSRSSASGFSRASCRCSAAASPASTCSTTAPASSSGSPRTALRTHAGAGRLDPRSARDWSASARRSGRPIALTNLPPDYLRIASGLGQAAPVQAVALPVAVARTRCSACSKSRRSGRSTRGRQALLDELLPVVAMSLEILQRNLRTQELLGQTQEQARQLEEQAAGTGRRQAEGRGSHRDEVHVPREHEPRDPHADERHHRPVAPRAEDRRSTPSSATTSARSTTPARRCSAIINDILDFSKIEAGKLDIETTDFKLDDVHQLGHHADRAEGAREGPGVPGRTSRRTMPAAPASATRCASARS